MYENVWFQILWHYFEWHILNFTRHLPDASAYGFLIKDIRIEAVRKIGCKVDLRNLSLAINRTGAASWPRVKN